MVQRPVTSSFFKSSGFIPASARGLVSHGTITLDSTAIFQTDDCIACFQYRLSEGKIRGDTGERTEGKCLKSEVLTRRDLGVLGLNSLCLFGNLWPSAYSL